MADNLVIFGTTYNNVAGFKATDTNGNTQTFTKGGGGGGSVSPVSSGVQFLDYDGTLLHAYSTQEAQALSALPVNPSHTGLTAQGWNWSLANIKSYLTNYPDAIVNVGQMYVTDDGKTRIYIHLGEERKSPILGVCPNGTVDVDWGDGTTHDTLTGTSVTTVKWTPTHNYAHGGDYVIKLTVTGTMGLCGTSSSNEYAYLLRHSSSADARNGYYQCAITGVELGSNTSIQFYAFYNCYSLTRITIPDGYTGIGDSAFYNCYSLTSLTFPNSMTSISSYAFYRCYSLTRLMLPDSMTNISNYAFYGCYSLISLTIPDGVTSILGSTFYYCYSLTSLTIPDSVEGSIANYAFYYGYSITNLTIPDSVTSISSYAFGYFESLTSLTIPDSVTSISNNAFSGCYGMAEYHILNTTPPTLGGTGAFSGMPSDCIIYVPYSADHSILNAYKTASNWSTYASYMQEEPT